MNEARIVSALPAWFAANGRDLPWRHTRDPYAVWISEVMLQQTQVKTVIPYWNRWMKALPDIASLAQVSEARLHKLWEGLGYYTRARNLQKAARLILERHDGRFPVDFDAVLALPGIGRYTAGAICSIAFDQPRPILDGNVIRVLARLFGIGGNVREKGTNRRLWELSERLVRAAQPLPRAAASPPRISPSLVNQALMELGALVCTPRQPQCPRCPVASSCAASRDGRTATLPNLGRRTRMTPRRFAAFLLVDGDRLFARQRPAKGVNAHLWEFPNLELTGQDETPRQAAERIFHAAPRGLKRAAVIKHSITTSRITLEVHVVQGLPTRAMLGAGQWLTARQMARLPFTAAHKKVWKRFALRPRPRHDGR